MTRLLLVRHGTTAWNAKHRVQGARDIPMNDEGQREAKRLAKRLESETVDALYASNLQRAWETAEAIAVPHSLTIRAEPRLREISFGEWEGQTRAEIRKHDSERLASWYADPMRRPPPGGETLAEVATRVGESYEDVVERHPKETVIVVAHGVTLRVLLCTALRIQPAVYWRFRLDLASLSRVATRDEGAVLEVLNDTSHLDSPHERQQPPTDEAPARSTAGAAG